MYFTVHLKSAHFRVLEYGMLGRVVPQKELAHSQFNSNLMRYHLVNVQNIRKWLNFTHFGTEGETIATFYMNLGTMNNIFSTTKHYFSVHIYNMRSPVLKYYRFAPRCQNNRTLR